MLLSRFWYLVLAASAAASLALAMLATGMFNREYVERVEEGLVRDRLQVESLLKIDARTRLDAIAPIAADGDIREALRKGKASESDQRRLRSLNKQLAGLKGDLLIAVDSNGQIVMQVGRKQPKEGAGLGAVPVVESALAGYLADDTWLYGGGVFRVAARPVVDSGRYVGAIVHAQRLDAQLSRILSERLGGATVGFFLGDRIIASDSPTDVVGAPTQDDLASGLGDALADEKLLSGERSEPVDLEGRGRAVYSLVAGSASAAKVGYVVARPYTTLATPFAIFERTTSDDVAALPKVPLAALMVLAFAIGLLIMFLERDRPLQQFRRDLKAIADGQAEEMDLGHQRGAFRRLAESVNAALDKTLELRGASGKTSKANLDEILGPAEASTSSAFSFGSADEEESSASLPMPGPQPAPLPPPAAPKAAPPRPPPPAPSDSAQTARKPPPPAPAAIDELSDFEEDDDEATVIAGADSELHAVVSEEGHFREVFDKYVTMRKQCGENTEGLTFEKFAGTLRKNREQILSKHDAKDVRFTVYEKGGKAALKATPVRP